MSIKYIKERLKAAKDLPWRLVEEDHDIEFDAGPVRWSAAIESVTWDCGVIQADPMCGCMEEVQQARATADFIINAPTDIAELLARIAELEWRLQVCEETRTELEASFKATVVEVERLKTLLPPFTPCPVCGVVSWYPPKEMDPAVDRSKCLACGEPKEVDP